MLDLRHLSEHPEEVREALMKRGPKLSEELDKVAALAEERRAGIGEVEGLRAERNEASAAMAKLDKKSEAFQQKRASLKALSDRIKELDARQKELEAELEGLAMRLPNLPDPSAPEGKGEADNPVIRSWGERPSFAFTPKDHYDLGVGLGILDFERAAKVSGARFAILRGAGARLERALISFMLDLHTGAHGYTELWPPALVREQALVGTSQLPKFKEDLFAIGQWGSGEGEGHALFLSPTAEVQVTNYHAEEILEEAELPRAYCAYSACYRSEAGSYGKDTRGLIRQHQFDKVELVRFARPEDGPAQLELLTSHAEAVLQALGLAYRVIELCTGDLGFGSKKTYDLEVWLPGQEAYREISSCSWFGDFQARRAKIRYRPEAEAGAKKAPKPRLAHTLNGSGLAVGRTLVAILEQGQQEDGSVVIPAALRPFMGGLERIAPGGA